MSQNYKLQIALIFLKYNFVHRNLNVVWFLHTIKKYQEQYALCDWCVRKKHSKHVLKKQQQKIYTHECESFERLLFLSLDEHLHHGVKTSEADLSNSVDGTAGNRFVLEAPASITAGNAFV